MGTVATGWRSGVIEWLDITARLAWIGAPFHFIRTNLDLLVAPATLPWSAVKLTTVKYYNPPARIADGALTR